MDTELLRTFIEVSKTRHFGKAAENLFLTQSAVSFRVKQLEEQLGNALFSRQRGNIHLTVAGERMLPYAEAILQTWGRARQDVALTKESNVQISIGAAPQLWQFDTLSNWISDVYQQVDGLAVRLESINRRDLYHKLLEKQIDIAITSEPPKSEEISSRNVQQYALVLVTCQSGLMMEEVKSLPLVYLDWGVKFAIDHTKLPALNRAPVLHTHSPKIALDFILANEGVGYLPEPVVQQALIEQRCFVVDDAPVIDQGIHLVWLDENPKVEQINAITHVDIGFNAKFG
ncbi:HTH-type transcriptional regulator HdfR [Thaumasiovibrio subtropicus]|uniref:HTH-type transcriptional regulator HdfR n=1 Tax=Thaumasiovibrio subtropicus TaxID=1891207 RepID=UPI000B35FC59|nr:HTH-type transcriptional regulator HdfR [Thaumasiovibrio subtropicus]